MPDLTDKENVQRLLNWEGGVGGITQIKMTRVSAKGAVADDKKKTEDEEMTKE